MWIFKLFSREKADPSYTVEELRDALQLELGGSYRVLLSEHSVAVERDDSLVAYVELVEGGSRAVLFYDCALRPFFAGDIALALDAILPTYLGDSEFTSQRLAEPAEDRH